MASECWPGKGFDRKRFVQLLVGSATTTKTISIPRLEKYLLSNDAVEEADLLSRAFFPDSYSGRILLGPDVDQEEGAVISLIGGSTPLTTIRNFSYASLIYKEIRSSYAHEYKIGNQADVIKMTGSDKSIVSYVNMGEDLDRLIHFPLHLIADVTLQCAASVDNFQDSIPISEPVTWWIDEKNICT